MGLFAFPDKGKNCFPKAQGCPKSIPFSIKYEDQVAYYEAFTSYRQNGNTVPMIRIFAEAEVLRLSETLNALGMQEDSE